MFRPSRAFRLRQQLPLRQTNQVPRRNQSSFIHRRTGEPMRYQEVRFKKPPFLSYRNAVTFALYGAVLWHVSGFILDRISIEVVESGSEEDPRSEHAKNRVDQRSVAEEEGDEEGFFAEEDSGFIPLTWPKALPRTFYKGSDPEWQEFMKVAKDKPRHTKLQQELVSIVYSGTQQHRGFGRQLGKDPKIGRYWLEITFPEAPPQEYERWGIEIGEDFVAWSKQNITAEQQWRLTRALWPTTAFDSVWATLNVLSGIQYRRIKQALGWEGRDPFSPEERLRTAIQIRDAKQQAQEGKAVGRTQMDPQGSPGSILTPGSTTPSPSPNDNPSPPPPSLPFLHFPVPMPPTTAVSTTDLPIAMHTFQQTLKKTWNPKKMEPPRGSFVVQGLVEVKGAKGRFIFDVQSCYDPLQRKFVFVNAGVRGYKSWKQGPKGGH